MKARSLALCLLLIFSSDNASASMGEKVFLSVGISLSFLFSYLIYKEFYDSSWRYRLALSACAKNNFFLLRWLYPDDRLFKEDDPTDYIGQIDGYSFPLLKSAVKNDNKELIDFLLKNGAQFNYNILKKACELNDVKFVKKYLKAGCPVIDTDEDYDCWHAIDFAYRNGNKDLVNLLLGAGESARTIILHYSLLKGFPLLSG